MKSADLARQVVQHSMHRTKQKMDLIQKMFAFDTHIVHDHPLGLLFATPGIYHRFPKIPSTNHPHQPVICIPRQFVKKL